jgi:hypothetical protein
MSIVGIDFFGYPILIDGGSQMLYTVCGNYKLYIIFMKCCSVGYDRKGRAVPENTRKLQNTKKKCKFLGVENFKVIALFRSFINAR